MTSSVGVASGWGQKMKTSKSSDSSAPTKTSGTLSASNLKTVEQLAAKRAELHQLRIMDERDWALNEAFYKGNQWVFWNRVSNQVESLPVMDGDKPRWKVRLTNNQVRPGVLHYVSQLTKTKPVINATPDSSSYRDMAAAQMAETLYEWWWQELHLKTKLQSALVNSCLSQGWWSITWDPMAGKSMKLLLDPNTGQPITDNELSDCFRDALMDQAEQDGIDPKVILSQYEKTIYVGDLCVEPVPGANVLIDPAPKGYEDAQYAFIKHTMDVDEIKGRWGVEVTPNANVSNTIPLYMQRKPEQSPKTVRDVYCGFFRPSALNPKGRIVYWLEDPNTILDDRPWDLPFNELPLVKFPGLERPGSSLDEPITTDARPLQKELNRTLSQIVQYKDLTIKPQMIAPLGSLRQRLTDEPGAVFEYQPIQGLMPEWRQTPALPQSSFNILADIQQRLDVVFNRIPTSRDSMPARIDAGYSIELLQESVADQLSPVIQRMEEALARAGKLMVLLAQKYYQEPRLLKIKGDSGSTQVRKFVNADLAGGFSFHPEAGTGLPTSRAGRQERIIELVNAGLMDPKQAQRRLDLADMKGIQAQFSANEDMAYREHDVLIKGGVLNQIAVFEAQQQVQQAMADPSSDPDGDYGGPDNPQEKMQWAQQQMQNAAVAPTDYEDWETHLSVHGLFMTSPEFGQLPFDAQQRITLHYRQTYQKVMGMKQMQMSLDPRVAPKVNLGFRATTSAPAAAEILQRVGVQVDPNVLAEPPLDTAVFDMVGDMPQQDTANTHMDAAAKLQEMQQAEEQHALKTAQTAHQMSLADMHAQSTAGAQQQQLQQAAEVHQTNMNHTRQMNAQKQQQAAEQHKARLRASAQSQGGK